MDGFNCSCPCIAYFLPPSILAAEGFICWGALRIGEAGDELWPGSYKVATLP